MHEFIVDDKRAKSLLNRIKAKTLPENFKLVEEFVQDRQVSNNCKLGSMKGYLDAIRLFIEVFPKKPFKKITAKDVKYFIAVMQGKINYRGVKYSDASIWNFKRSLKSLFLWLKRVEPVEWIKRPNGVGINTPEQILEARHLNALIKSCKATQGNALISVLYESATRLGEFLGMDIEDISFDDLGAKIRVGGKTGQRQIRLINSVLPLQRWIQMHPVGKGALWVNSKKERYTHQSIERLLDKLGNDAGFTFKLYPHLFRKSRLTELASRVPEQVLKNFAGWSKASRMPMHYVFMTGKQVDDALALVSGKEIKVKDKGLKVMACHCGQENSVDALFCVRCGRVLKEDIAFKIESKRQVADEVQSRLDEVLMQDPNYKALKVRLMEIVLKEKGIV